MRSYLFLLLLGCFFSFSGCKEKSPENKPADYLVLYSADVKGDPEWMKVVDALQTKHDARMLPYQSAPAEILSELKKINPRWVAIVEKPENLNRDFIINVHRMSREVDEDIYADFLWGVITGYDAAGAMKMVNNSTEPFVIRNAVATIMELNSAKWFDTYAWVDDHTKGLWGEKKGKEEAVVTGMIDEKEVLKKFTELYAAYEPDLLVTAAHATEKNLEMPFSLGNIKAKEGKLYAEDRYTRETWDLKESGKKKVYFAVGNCLIGNVNNTPESMAIAWMNGGNATTMIGYVVTTWHGRNGWGGLKYWLTTPGRYTLAEAIYLNQQDLMYQLEQWNPQLTKVEYDYSQQDLRVPLNRLAQLLDTIPTIDQLGFWHDRDVLAYYGDPKWEIRLQEIPEENDYTVTVEKEAGKYILTIKTKPGFSMKRLAGDGFKEEHVLDIPFSYFFPERLKNPRLAAGQDWKVAVDENFLLVYNPDFQPDRSYRIVLEVEE